MDNVDVLFFYYLFYLVLNFKVKSLACLYHIALYAFFCQSVYHLSGRKRHGYWSHLVGIESPYEV